MSGLHRFPVADALTLRADGVVAAPLPAVLLRITVPPRATV